MDEYVKGLNKKKAPKPKKAYHPFDDMMSWEDGSLNEKGTTRLFQHLVNTGQAYHLQGMYGRQANALLDAGIIKPPKNSKEKDAYGNPLHPYFESKRKK